jgi:hypothetical protein
MVRQQTKTIFPKRELKGKKYKKKHPRIDAYVPGAPGRKPINPQVAIKSKQLFSNLDNESLLPTVSKLIVLMP